MVVTVNRKSGLTGPNQYASAIANYSFQDAATTLLEELLWKSGDDVLTPLAAQIELWQDLSDFITIDKMGFSFQYSFFI